MQDFCSQRCIHQDVVEKAAGEALEEELIDNLSQLFKAYADQTRLKIFLALDKNEMCVCDLAALLGISESAVSHQLRYLRNLRLVKKRKEGNVVYYSLYDGHCSELLAVGITHLSH
ncbi:MAG: transcriptional regulator [Deltaproteobacteria bacterium]|nr:MAG: transcriptional regulator [Deltaproteobacteria bacterium]